MLEDRYHRLNPTLGRAVYLDSTKRSEMDYLLLRAEKAKLVDRVNRDVETLDWIGDYFFYA